jgi:hypothetical protein
MSNRSVRRVPLDFDWPIGEKWEGFVNPVHKKFIVCEHCRGDGISKEARALEKIWYGATSPEYDPKTNIVDFGKIECEYGFIFHFTRHSHTRNGVFYLAMQERNYHAFRARWKPKRGYATLHPPAFEKWLEQNKEDPVLFAKMNSAWMYLLDEEDVKALHDAGALRSMTHTWYKGKWVESDVPVHLSPEMVDLHIHDTDDSIFGAQWIAIEAFCRRHNLHYTCPHCQGAGGRFPDNATKAAALGWSPYDPPAGNGYQFWEPSDEGAPLSPVFETPDDLTVWMVKQGVRLNKKVDIKKTLKWIESKGTKGLSSTEFIWLYREYRIKLKQPFHPTLMPDLAYGAPVPTQ